MYQWAPYTSNPILITYPKKNVYKEMVQRESISLFIIKADLGNSVATLIITSKLAI